MARKGGRAGCAFDYVNIENRDIGDTVSVLDFIPWQLP